MYIYLYIMNYKTRLNCLFALHNKVRIYAIFRLEAATAANNSKAAANHHTAQSPAVCYRVVCWCDS